MEERELKLTRNDDPTLVDVDIKAVEKEVNHAHLVLSQMKEHLNKGNLNRGYCETLCGCFEMYAENILGLLDYDSVIKRQKEERYAEIKRINFENRELRKQLGEKVSAEDVRECLKNLKEIINKWWDEEGMGYISSLEFSEYVIKMELSGSLSMSSSKDQVEKLRTKGYEIVMEDRTSSHGSLSCSDKNIELLKKEVRKRFPSATLFSVDSYYDRGGQGLIRKAEFYIKSYDDVFEQEEKEEE